MSGNPWSLCRHEGASVKMFDAILSKSESHANTCSYESFSVCSVLADSPWTAALEKCCSNDCTTETTVHGYQCWWYCKVEESNFANWFSCIQETVNSTKNAACQRADQSPVWTATGPYPASYPAPATPYYLNPDQYPSETEFATAGDDEFTDSSTTSALAIHTKASSSSAVRTSSLPLWFTSEWVSPLPKGIGPSPPAYTKPLPPSYLGVAHNAARNVSTIWEPLNPTETEPSLGFYTKPLSPGYGYNATTNISAISGPHPPVPTVLLPGLSSLGYCVSKYPNLLPSQSQAVIKKSESAKPVKHSRAVTVFALLALSILVL
jgi:hypothetical protein